ncbi:hypothetical protein CLV80_110124 [Yoonia maritima]|uniref:Competence protein CoiA nuclease-like domain-containing protein n=1 Tax=Yoonia maritima TaxID=1435347 RepID=A0A2T0VW98_9RHOB|nr:hypothetical protein [Yoonia maritima]PRY76038.1 hypothetical protein CLV80_110124 [Yoonia maritima]
MGQIAYRADTGEIVEAFSVSDLEWDALCNAQTGTVLMPRSKWPAVPKTSSRGLRFFAHNVGFSGNPPKPESYAHTRLKIDILKAARSLGYTADLEVAGSTPDGNQWIADVLVTLPNGNKTAFEVQLSSQHLNDFRLRTKRYRESSVKCCWIISEEPVGNHLRKAIFNENFEYNQAHIELQVDDEDLLTFGVTLKDKSTYPDSCPTLRFGRGQEIRRMSLQDAIDGFLKGCPIWRRPTWYWQAN